MRSLLAVALACLFTVTLAYSGVNNNGPRDSSNNPIALKKPIPFGNSNNMQAAGPGTGNQQLQQQHAHIQQPQQQAVQSNYLVTLRRTVSNSQKDKLLDALLDAGAVVKQVYDYRVYKGVLFQVPPSLDKGLKSWTSTLLEIDGVKEVEEDQLVKIN